MTDEKFEEFLRREAPRYRTPPETPREEMWARIAVRRRTLGAPARPPVWWTGRRGAGVAIAALLVLGFALGRFTAAPSPAAGPLRAGEPAPDSAVLRLAAADYLRQTETFLSTFLVEARSGRADQGVREWAHDLLGLTRLILDAPTTGDNALRHLVEDLELVLIQIIQYTEHADASELQFIEDGLDESAVQLRLRATLAGDDETFVRIGAE